MKRIGIITFLHNDNYGSTLQAWALQHTLRQMGYDAIHLDYMPDTKEKVRNLITSRNSPALLLDSLRRHQVKTGQQSARTKSAAFADFRKQHMQLTAPCRQPSALSAASRDMDALICGSDQVWSPEWFNPVYYLNFAGKQPRLAYACSLGVSHLDSRFKARRICQLLKPFSAISVREQEGADLIQPLCEQPVSVMPDPVLLVPPEEWQRLAAPWQTDRPYIACYFIGDRPDYWEKVRAIKQSTGLDVVVIPVAENAWFQGYTLAEGLSPDQWLGVLMGAERIITDSFHGTVFSMLLQRPLTILRRYSDDDHASKNSRIDHFLRLAGVNNTQGWDDAAPYADHLSHLRTQGSEWLLTHLKQAGL